MATWGNPFTVGRIGFLWRGGWDDTVGYDFLDVVRGPLGLTTYIMINSNSPAPAGTALTDTDYWDIFITSPDTAAIETALDALTANMTDAIDSLDAMIGVVMPFPTLTLPSSKWQPANGQLLLRTAYPALSALLGNTFPGSTTEYVALPNLNTDALFIRGTDPSDIIAHPLGETQGDAIRNIEGNFSIHGGAADPTSNTWHVAASGAFEALDSPNLTAVYVSTGVTSVNTVNRNDTISLNLSAAVPTADENRPVNMRLYYAVKVL